MCRPVASINDTFLVEFGCDAEEERAVDFVYAHSVGHVEHFVVAEVGAFGDVELFGVYFDLGVFGDAAQEEDYGQKQAYLDSNGEVEDDGEKEGDDKHGYIALGSMEYADDCAPAAHIISHDHEDGCQTCHWHVVDQRHGEKEY